MNAAGTDRGANGDGCGDVHAPGGTPVTRPDPSFWATPAVAEAAARQDFGRLLRLFRTACVPRMSQIELANLLELTQGQVSRIEAGRSTATDLVKLARWADAIGVPDDVLWFRISVAQHDAVAPSEGPAGPPAVPSMGHAEVSAPRPGPLAKTGEQVIGRDHVEILQNATSTFRTIDNQYGGYRGRGPVAAFLTGEVGPAIAAGRFARGVRPAYERAAAQLYQLAGWIDYDVGDAESGRRNLRIAFDLANSADDDGLAAEMLSAMSHHAAFLRQPDQALDLAVAARRYAQRSGSPALQAESAALEAHGLALLKDGRGAVAALHRAESLFSAADIGNTPAWLGYFDRAYLSAKFAHALRDVGMSRDAERFARASLVMSDGYERGRLFNTALLSSILADGGQVEEASATLQSAVEMAGRVASTRAGSYIRDAYRRLAVHKDSAPVRDLRQAMRRQSILATERPF